MTRSKTDTYSPWLRSIARVIHRPALPAFRRGVELLDGRYVIGDLLGNGGMGAVYEAWDRRAGSSVALKTLMRSEPALIYRFKLEFRVLADVVHPNLARMHALFEDRGRWCLVMDLLRGRTLADVIERRPSLRAVRAIFTQIAEGVSAIHAAGCLHRDLKPQNVIITDDGRAVIADFGLACIALTGGPGQTVSDGQMIGTPGYCAPEQMAGRGATEASDWYAFGVMLRDALGGSPSGRRGARGRDRRQPRPAPPSRRTLADLSSRLLAFEPERRATEAIVRGCLGLPRRTVPSPTACPRTAPRGKAVQAARRLRQDYRQFRQHPACVTFVLGPPGCGKTALAARFIARVRARRDALVLSSRCDPRESLPFGALDPIIDELSRVLRALTVDRARALAGHEFGALSAVFPALARLGELCAGPVSPPRLQAAAAQAHTAAALKAVLARLAAHRRLIVLIDDAHHADVESARLLARVLEHPDPAPLFLIVCARSGAGRRQAHEGTFARVLLAVPRVHSRTLWLPSRD